MPAEHTAVSAVLNLADQTLVAGLEDGSVVRLPLTLAMAAAETQGLGLAGFRGPNDIAAADIGGNPEAEAA
jgi:hypothetical protein